MKVIVACLVAISACGGDAGPPVPDASEDPAEDAAIEPPPFRGVVALNTNLSSTDAFDDYRVEYPATYALGARGAQTAGEWRALEGSPQGGPCTPSYDLTMITNPYFGLDALTADGFTEVLMNLAIVSLDRRSMPCDLVALPFDDPAVKARYRSLLDQVIPHLGTNVKYVAFGNEVDSYFKSHVGEWAAYKSLVEDAKVHLQSARPDIKVGVTTTWEGATSTFATDIASLNEAMDVIILTYYPIDHTTFTVRDPSTVAADLAAAVEVAGTRPLVLQEWGYPSSGVLGSDDQKQAAFVANTFAAWTAHGADKIPFLSFFKRRDWTQTHCEAQCPISPPPPQCLRFEAYLCTLGFLHNDGTPKPAQQTLIDQMTALQIGN